MADLAPWLRRVPQRVVVAALAILALGLLLREQSSAHGSRAEAGTGRPLRIEDPATYFPTHGFVEMVPPIEPPSRGDASNRVNVWLRMPEGGLIDVEDAEGRHLLHFPPGSEAARAESIARGDPSAASTFTVRDVRGTRLEPSGRELFFVYRPAARAGHALAGFEWHRDSPSEEKAATNGILELLARVRPGPGLESALRRVRTQNQCALCHVHGRRDNLQPRELGVVNRGTDASGFFLIPTVLSAEAPLEAYEPRNPALESPYVALRCASGPATIERTGLAKASCADGSVPRATLDVPRALADGDAHARRLCESRAYLLAHMAPATRALFAEAAKACGTLSEDERPGGRL